MHCRLTILLAGLIALLSVCTTATYAQEPESSSVQQKYYGNIPYVSGGVGLDERDALAQMSKDYNLKLSFAQTSGNYLGDVAVQIRNSEGRVILEAASDGPWFFTNLPSGHYTVVVNDKDKIQTKSVRVTDKTQTALNFFWQ